MPSYRQVFSSLIELGILYAIFRYAGNFTEIQSILLALVAVFAIEGCVLAYKTAAKQPNFEPYWVSVMPNWCAIFNDFVLAPGKKWTEIQRRCEAVPPEKYSVLRSGLNFTVLSPTLFYSNDHNTFFGDLDLRMTIEELKPEPGGRFSFAPQFYVKRTLVGEKRKNPAIEFGIRTPESIQWGAYPSDKKTNIPIAWFPETVFFGFTRPDADHGTGRKVRKQAESELIEFGWTAKKEDQEDSWLDWPEEINHKYFKVRYRGLS